MTDMEETLQRCPLFRNMSLVQIEALLAKYPHRLRAVPEKDFVILQNELCDNLMIVVEGLVQAQMVDTAGKQMVIDELGANELLAPAFMFSDVNRMPVSVFVQQAARILYFRRSVFLNMMQENQTVLLNFLNIISNRSRFLSERLKFHVFTTLKGKIASYLLEEQSEQNTLSIRLRYTQQELAEKFGVARPSLARALSEFEKEGLIEVRSKNVKIKDLQALRRSLE